MEDRKPVEVWPDGGGGSWWYVCGECHSAVNYHTPVCPSCKNKLNWEPFNTQGRKLYTGEQTEPAE